MLLLGFRVFPRNVSMALPLSDSPLCALHSKRVAQPVARLSAGVWHPWVLDRTQSIRLKSAAPPAPCGLPLTDARGGGTKVEAPGTPGVSVFVSKAALGEPSPVLAESVSSRHQSPDTRHSNCSVPTFL